MKLFEKLSLGRDSVDFQWELGKLSVREEDLLDRRLLSNYKSTRVSYNWFVALGYYLLDEHADAARYCQGCLDAAEEFFFGNWRSELETDEGTHDVGWWKNNINWEFQLQWALVCGSAIGQWDQLARVCSYLDENVPTRECGKEQTTVYRAIGERLNGAEVDTCLNRLETAFAGKAKKARLMAQTYRSILLKDEAAANRDFDAYLKACLKRDLDREAVAPDESSFFHLGLHEGLNIDVRDQYRDHLFILNLNG